MIHIFVSPDGPTTQADGLDLVHYLALRTPVELVVFLRNLAAYLDAHPSVSAPSSLPIPADVGF